MVLMLTTSPCLSLTMLHFTDSAQTLLVFPEQAKLHLDLPWLFPLLKTLFSQMFVCCCCFLSSFSFSAPLLALLGPTYLKSSLSSYYIF